MPDSPRVTVDDAYRAAESVFAEGQRLDMGQLATDLGIGKATLYRWVGSRDALLSHVLARLAAAAFEEAAVASTHLQGPARFETFARLYIGSIVEMEPLAAFIRVEGRLAVRLITSRGGLVQRTVTELLGNQLRVMEARGDLVLRAPVEELAYAMTRVAEGFIYNDQAAEMTPDVDAAVRILMLLAQ